MQLDQSELNEELDGPAALASNVYVLLCQPELITDPILLAHYKALLDDVERARLARFHFEIDSHTFLVAHALVRTALSHFANVHPSEWRFRTDGYGRPEVFGPIVTSRLKFNLSHCHGLIACLVTNDVDSGVDVEKIRVSGDLLTLAEHSFSRDEAATLRTLPKEILADWFFSLWTLKESYTKARGLGLSLPLNKFSFRFRGGCITAHFDPDLAENPDDWTFTLMRPIPSHFLATAVRHGRNSAQLQLVLRWFVPLVGLGTALPSCRIASSNAIVIAP